MMTMIITIIIIIIIIVIKFKTSQCQEQATRKVLSLNFKYKTSSPYNAPHSLLSGPGYNGWKAGNLVIIIIIKNKI